MRSAGMKAYLLALLSFLACTAFAQSGRPSEQADKVVILKSERTLKLLRSGKLIKTYKVALGNQPKGAKEQQGDGKTPEGDYFIDSRNAKSAFYKSLHISYPNKRDIENAKTKGVNAGGDIFIHGIGKKYGWLGAAHRLHDWTLGCIAVTNEEIDEIWTLVPNGTSVEIRP